MTYIRAPIGLSQYSIGISSQACSLVFSPVLFSAVVFTFYSIESRVHSIQECWAQHRITVRLTDNFQWLCLSFKTFKKVSHQSCSDVRMDLYQNRYTFVNICEYTRLMIGWVWAHCEHTVSTLWALTWTKLSLRLTGAQLSYHNSYFGKYFISFWEFNQWIPPNLSLLTIRSMFTMVVIILELRHQFIWAHKSHITKVVVR